jgi:hypothetical protein
MPIKTAQSRRLSILINPQSMCGIIKSAYIQMAELVWKGAQSMGERFNQVRILV